MEVLLKKYTRRTFQGFKLLKVDLSVYTMAGWCLTEYMLKVLLSLWLLFDVEGIYLVLYIFLWFVMAWELSLLFFSFLFAFCQWSGDIYLMTFITVDFMVCWLNTKKGLEDCVFEKYWLDKYWPEFTSIQDCKFKMNSPKWP